MEQRQNIDKKKIYIVFFTTWIFYVIQIIIILCFTLADINYYSERVLIGDLIIFLISCGNSIFVTYSILRNKFIFYKSIILLTILLDLIIAIYINIIIFNKKFIKNDGMDTILIIIKLLEIIPGWFIIYNYKGINASNNNMEQPVLHR